MCHSILITDQDVFLNNIRVTFITAGCLCPDWHNVGISVVIKVEVVWRSGKVMHELQEL